MASGTSVLAPAVGVIGFHRMYDARDGVALDAGIFNAIIATPGTALETTLPDGTVEMKGFEGIDLIFCGTGSADDDFNFQIWFWYLIGDPTADVADRMYLPKLVGSSDETAAANELGAFVGVDGEYIENELKFADKVGAITNSAHQTFLEKFNTVSANVEVESPASDGVAMVSIRNVAGAHAVRVHVYETGAGIATTMQVLCRLTRGLNP